MVLRHSATARGTRGSLLNSPRCCWHLGAQSSHRLAPPCAPQLAVSALSTSSAVSFWKRKSQISLKSIISKRLKVAHCFSEGTAGGEGGEGKKRKRRNRIVVLRAFHTLPYMQTFLLSYETEYTEYYQQSYPV